MSPLSHCVYNTPTGQLSDCFNLCLVSPPQAQHCRCSVANTFCFPINSSFSYTVPSPEETLQHRNSACMQRLLLHWDPRGLHGLLQSMQQCTGLLCIPTPCRTARCLEDHCSPVGLLLFVPHLDASDSLFHAHPHLAAFINSLLPVGVLCVNASC